MVLDGSRGPSATAIGEMAFSADGRRLAYAAERNGAWHVVVDGQLGEPFDSLFAGSLDFDTTGRRYAFVAWQDGLAVPVVGGIRRSAHDAVAQIGFSSDGRRFGYLARDAGGVRLSVDGVFGDEHDTITEFRFSPSSREVAYIARDAGLWGRQWRRPLWTLPRRTGFGLSGLRMIRSPLWRCMSKEKA